MSDGSIHDRYQVPPGNPEAEFVDAQQLVLANKRGITDLAALQTAEEEELAKAYEELFSDVRLDTPMSCDLLKHVHQRIFGALYEWAGNWRTVQISKPGAIWPPPHYLDQAMGEFERTVLAKHPAASLADDEQFCTAVGEIQGEFLAIHPFREGNARTIKLLTDLLAAQCGKPLLLYDASEKGKEQYLLAAKAALLKKDYRPIVNVVREALGRARGQT